MASEDKTRPELAPEQAPAPDLFRSWLQTMAQELLRTEFVRFVGAQPYERTPARQGYRNGTDPRRLHTRVGSLTLTIPRDRAGLFRPALFAKYERREQALVLAMIEMYFHGVSTRKVSAIVEQLCGTSISASEVSALTRKLDAGLTTWRERRLTDTAYPALMVDAHVEQVRRERPVDRGALGRWGDPGRPSGTPGPLARPQCKRSELGECLQGPGRTRPPRRHLCRGGRSRRAHRGAPAATSPTPSASAVRSATCGMR